MLFINYGKVIPLRLNICIQANCNFFNSELANRTAKLWSNGAQYGKHLLPFHIALTFSHILTKCYMGYIAILKIY